MRILAVDVGTVRTGLAVSDPAGITCRPLEVLRAPDEVALVDDILAVAEREGASTIVVGLPRPLSGGTNTQLERVSAFVVRLSKASSLPVCTWDERFTTKLARGSRPRGTPVDSVAACHLLQSYLDSPASSREA